MSSPSPKDGPFWGTYKHQFGPSENACLISLLANQDIPEPKLKIAFQCPSDLFAICGFKDSSDYQIFQYVAGTILNLPPSMIMTFPVTYAPARLVRNRIAPAMSSSVPIFSKGI